MRCHVPLPSHHRQAGNKISKIIIVYGNGLYIVQFMVCTHIHKVLLLSNARIGKKVASHPQFILEILSVALFMTSYTFDSNDTSYISGQYLEEKLIYQVWLLPKPKNLFG